MGPNDVTDWHYCLNDDGTVSRGRAYRLDDPDAWRNYWDGDGMVGFTVRYRPCNPEIEVLADDDNNYRAVAAWRAERNGERNSEGSLDRLAPRLTGCEDSVFLCVSLDPSLDFYVLAWSGDDSGDWTREIRDVYDGDVYRFEVEDFNPGHYPMVEHEWMPADDLCEEAYGEDTAMTELRKMFPLDYFPAEAALSEAGA